MSSPSRGRNPTGKPWPNFSTGSRATSNRDPLTPPERARNGRQGARVARPTPGPRPHVLRPPPPGPGRRGRAVFAGHERPRGLEALALLGTPASQRSLVEFASHQGVPIEARQHGRPRIRRKRRAARHAAHQRRNPPPIRSLQRQRRRSTPPRKPCSAACSTRSSRSAPRPPPPARSVPPAINHEPVDPQHGREQPAGRTAAGHHRLRPGDAGGLSRHAAGRAQPGVGAAVGRDGHGQGADRPRRSTS